MRRTALLGLALVSAMPLACDVTGAGPNNSGDKPGVKDPTDPSDPSNPPGPNNPTDPTNPGNPPTDPTAPTEPVDPEEMACEPGTVTMRRLNRTEFDNTIRDLTGLDLRLGRDFPADDFGYGFDNIGDVLSVSPLLLEKMDAAADTIVEAMLDPGEGGAGGGVSAGQVLQAFEAEALGGSAGGASGEGWNLWSNGEIVGTANVPAAGTYLVRVRAYGQQAGAEPARMEVRAGNTVLGTVDVAATAYQSYEVSGTLPAGQVAIAVAFTNDHYDQATSADRNLVVDRFEVVATTAAPGAEVPAPRARVMVCTPAAGEEETCAREILSRFASRAWRRPAATAEVDQLMGLYNVALEQGDGFEQGVRLALKAILVSPHFLYRVELDDNVAPGETRMLGGYELASRLSYFLWSSMPDEALFAKAQDGSLLDPAVLEAEMHRMLLDEKAQAFVASFAGQWLNTRGIHDAFPDPVEYPEWDVELKDAMEQETALVFQELLMSDRSFLDLLDADFTYVNERLAQHYGIPGIEGDEMQRIQLTPDSPRAGVLTHGSFLTTTSHPTRTSPVKRGQLILEKMLCIAPPPPPPGVEGLTEEVDPTASLRERFEQHRADPSCASCHQLMDPFGFALEHFDGIGAYRETDHGFDIDASGLYMGITHFDDHKGLVQLMKQDPLFPDCVSQKALIYALGRGLSDVDSCTIGNVVAQFQGSDFRLTELLSAIVKSEAFRMRQREGGDQ